MSYSSWLLIGEGVDNVEAGKKLLKVICGVPSENIKALSKERGEILKKLKRYLNHKGNLLIIVDLESGQCAPALLRSCGVSSTPAGKCVRVAVRMIENWVLADVDGFSEFFRVNRRSVEALVGSNADTIIHAKREVVNLCRDFREGMAGNGRHGTGPLYSKFLREFIRETWSPLAAAARSPSLEKAINCLRRSCQ